MAEIVVGVDGSPASRVALDWALQQARLTNAEVRAVYVATPASGGLREPEPQPSLAARRADAERLLEGVVAQAVKGADGFYGLMLGSVSQQVAQHAPCPVVVIPTPKDAG